MYKIKHVQYHLLLPINDAYDTQLLVHVGCLLEVFDENKQTKRPNLGMVLPNLVWSEGLASHGRVAMRFVWFVQRSEDACGVVCGGVPWESGWGPQVDFTRQRS